MSENPFSGATRDPIALLEQLIGQVGGLKNHMQDLTQEVSQVRQELSQVRQELTQEIGQVRQEIGQVRQELTQEIGQVKLELTQEIGQVKLEITRVEHQLGSRIGDLHAEVSVVRSDITNLRSDFVRFASALDKEQEAHKATVEAVIERKHLLARHEWQDKHADIERRVAELEETERRRKEGKGA